MRTAKWPARYKPMLALSSPQMLCTLVVSIASLRVNGSKIVGIRFAIIDFGESFRLAEGGWVVVLAVL